jgi:hypothetical protein
MESLLQQQSLKETNDNMWTKDKRENGCGVGNPRLQSSNPRRKTATRK